jgi:uncharacterized protein (TIGR02246 family)
MQAMVPELLDVTERWYRAWLEKDACVVAELAAEDYLYVGPNGMTMDRAAVLAVIRSPTYRLVHATRTDVVVRSLGQEAGIVRHRFQGAGAYEGSPFTDDNRCVMVWEKQDGRWRLVMDHCSFCGEARGTSPDA